MRLPNKYRWEDPIEWLLDKCLEWNETQLRTELIEVATYLDMDTLQDIYESDMDKDGYFDPIE